MARSEANKAPTRRLQYLGDIGHLISKINKETKWANITLFKQNNNFVIQFMISFMLFWVGFLKIKYYLISKLQLASK